MMEFSARETRTWSMLGQRGTVFSKAIPDIMQKKENCYVVTADLGKTSGMDRIMQNTPEHFVNVGIAEQNLVGVSAGLAFEGNVVFASTFATFITMRCFEQCRHNLGYLRANVKLVGGSSGFAIGMFGTTHYAYEDIALMRSIPGMTVIAPADASEAYFAAIKAAETNDPTYIRLSDGANAPILHKERYEFNIGEAMLLRTGKRVAIISTGGVLNDVLEAINILQERGIEPTVVNMHTIKPIDVEMLESLMHYDYIFTVEEHSIIGGLGSAVSEYYTEYKTHPVVIRLGAKDEFLKPGSQAYVKHQCGLDSMGIVESVLKYVK